MRKKDSFALILVLIIITFLMFITGLVIYMSFRTGNIEKASGELYISTGEGGGDCPDRETTKSFWGNKGIVDNLLNNLSTYKSAGTAAGIDWEILAAMHYRESTMSPASPNKYGPYQLVSLYDGGANKADITDFKQSSRMAAAFIRNKARMVAGFKTPLYNAPDKIVRETFYAYIGHSGISPLASTYVMNLYDKRSFDSPYMMWTKGGGGGKGTAYKYDTKVGGFTVYKLLKTANIDTANRKIDFFAKCTNTTNASTANTTTNPKP